MATFSSCLDIQLTCSVCLERYTDPRTLLCHHNFCLQCLIHILVEEGQDVITCPICRNPTQLPDGRVCELPPAFLVNNLLEIRDAVSLDYYCETCEEFICSESAIRNHRSHECGKVTKVSEKYKQQIKHQLKQLSKDMARVEKVLGEVNSITEKVNQEENAARENITETVEQFHRHLEETKGKLMEMLEQSVQQKRDYLTQQRHKIATTLEQMRSCQELAEEKLQNQNFQEIIVTKNEIEKHISEVREHCNSAPLKCTAPNNAMFLANADSAELKLGVLLECGVEHQAGLKELIAGEKYTLYLYVPRSKAIVPSCQLVPHDVASVKPTECHVNEVGKEKYQVSFTPCHVGIHQLKVVGMSTMAVAQIQVNSPILKRKDVLMHHFSQPSGVAVTGEGQVLVCERGTDCINVLGAQSLGFIGRTKGLISPSCVTVTPDNHIIVVRIKHGRHHIYKLQLSGWFLHKISHTGKNSPTLHDPTGVAVHSSGRIFVVDRSSHCIHVFNQDCTFSHSFGEQGNAQGQFSLPHSIAFDSTGNAYITDSQNHRIQKFTSEGEFMSVIGGSQNQLKQPTALCIDRYNTILVADVGNKRIAVFHTCGTFMGAVQYQETTLTNPHSMAVDGRNDYLYVADCITNTLYVFH